MVRPLETIQNQEWRDWKQIKAVQYKREQELKEYYEWKKNGNAKLVKETSQPKGRELVRAVCQRFAF
jgi:hypothetical protein